MNGAFVWTLQILVPVDQLRGCSLLSPAAADNPDPSAVKIIARAEEGCSSVEAEGRRKSSGAEESVHGHGRERYHAAAPPRSHQDFLLFHGLKQDQLSRSCLEFTVGLRTRTRSEGGHEEDMRRTGQDVRRTRGGQEEDMRRT